jgi:murein L,D-transpeptidase YcbB/YkuD
MTRAWTRLFQINAGSPAPVLASESESGVKSMKDGVILRWCVLAGIALAGAGCAETGGAPSVEPALAGAWDRQDIAALVDAAEHAGADGLDPADYHVDDLRAALAAGDEGAAVEHASGIFAQLAGDLAGGRVAPEGRERWFIAAAPVDRPAIGRAMAEALAANRVKEELAAFAPDHPQYLALKAALAAATDAEAISKLRLNMERWRWMPRDLGPDYLLVNVAAFELAVFRNGAEVDRRRIIAGAVKLPTPQFSALATGVTFNPVWYVPTSIVAESVGDLLKRDPEKAARQGYYIGPDGGVRQKPGPSNSLGLMKLIMPNRHSVFLHDTPAKALFKRDRRDLSHGCIRVEGALDFAGILLGPAWDGKAIAEVVATGSTVSVEFERPIPVYVGYFTAVAGPDGAASFYPDVYGLDGAILSAAQRPDDGAAEEGSDEIGGCPDEPAL